MTETDPGPFNDISGTKVHAMFADEDSNRFHIEIERDGDIHVIDIAGWFRDVVPMPGITEESVV